jgi:hypothetical protein
LKNDKFLWCLELFFKQRLYENLFNEVAYCYYGLNDVRNDRKVLFMSYIKEFVLDFIIKMVYESNKSIVKKK